MIIRLKRATFTANIGKLDSWSIRTSVIGGSLTQVPSITSIQKDSTTSTVLTYKYDAAAYEVSTVTVTSNGTNVGSIDTNTSGEIKVTIPAGNTLSAAVQININLSAVGGGSETTYYTITYKYMSGSTSIKTQFTEQVVAGTIKRFSASDAPVIDGYTVSSVSPDGQQTINSDITVTYNYTANAVAEITTFFTTGTKGSKKESTTINGFTWVMPKSFLTSRVNAITVPVYLYKDEYEYVDLLCEIMEPNEAGSTKAPTRKEGMCAITRMTNDGDAVFNISFDASDIIADCCLIGVKALDKKKIAFRDTSGSSAWKTATASTGSSGGATPCCTYYATNSSNTWVSSSAANTRYLELSTDASATKYTLNYTNPFAIGTGLIRTLSNYGCIGGIAPGADIYAGDILTTLSEDSYCIDNNTGDNMTIPVSVTGDIDCRLVTLGEGGQFFQNGNPTGAVDNLESGSLDYTAWGWILPKQFVTLPVSKVSVPTMSFKESQVPIEVKCELLDTKKTVIKTVTETVTNATGGHDFNLAFTKDDIPGDWCYLAISIVDAATNGTEFGFVKIAESGEWYDIIKDKATYPPIYKYGTSTNWSTASSPNYRHFALKTNG